jgi:hypothetical protein
MLLWKYVLVSVKPPIPEEIKKLTVTDIATMGGLADSLRDRLEKHIEIAPYTMPDPLGDKDDCNYSIIVDREGSNRIVAMIASKKDPLPQLPWNKILGERLIKLQWTPTTFTHTDVLAGSPAILCLHSKSADSINVFLKLELNNQ